MLAALEVTSRPGSVAVLDPLSADDSEEVFLPDQVDTACAVLPALEGLLAKRGLGPKDLSAVAVAVGPGGFTGIRVGIAMAQGLCLPDNLPCFGVNTLAMLAENLRAGGLEGEALCLLDAQRGEVCVSHYYVSAEGVEEKTPPRVLSPAKLADFEGHRFWLVGDGALACEKEIREVLGARGVFAFTQMHRLSAKAAARLALRRLSAGERPKVQDLKPLYMRPPAAEEKT